MALATTPTRDGPGASIPGGAELSCRACPCSAGDTLATQSSLDDLRGDFEPARNPSGHIVETGVLKLSEIDSMLFGKLSGLVVKFEERLSRYQQAPGELICLELHSTVRLRIDPLDGPL